MTSSPVGPIVAGDILEQAAIDTLRAWFPFYLGEIARQRGLDPGKYPNPRSYKITAEIQKWPEDQIPAVQVISPGEVEGLQNDDDGYYRARHALGVAVVVDGQDQSTTNQAAKVYAACARAILIHKPALGGIANGVFPRPLSFNEIPPERTRTLAVAFAEIEIDVPDVLYAYPDLPETPPAVPRDPLPDTPLVDTVEVETDRD